MAALNGTFEPRAIRNDGTTVGILDNAPSIRWALSAAPSKIAPFGFESGVINGQNEQNMVVGAAPADGPEGIPQGFVWNDSNGDRELVPSEVRKLSSLGGPGSEAYDVNDPGIVVGAAEQGAGETFKVRPVLWNGSAPTDLGTLGGSNGRALSINSLGEIAGWAENAAGDQHAFLWSKLDGLVDVGTLGGKASVANSIDDNGRVVGWARTAAGISHAFMWRLIVKSNGQKSGLMVDLNDLLPFGSGWTLMVATAINNAGEVAGWGDFMGKPTAFLLFIP
jgi:probable HAF family extracellular repeat protein